MNDLIQFVQKEIAQDITHMDFFKAGDNVAVNYKIKEGNKERIQTFRGDVIQIKGEGINKTFTVRKVTHGVGVERIFPFNSPYIDGVKNLKKGNVRRARLYYLRNLSGKSARIREKKFNNKLDASMKGKSRRATWNWEEKVVK